ncbi:DMT family transporter [Candidatus Nitrotoga arctica]|uniref:EamA domain-containing protein n=1 Tax=Candidatus Nitrotoga arctica TaxID=453162 RepID=A0ABN8ANW0_9PROT|nr:DMT family transporter [Candidatus Nitrotoga arctica]CAG9932877.1 conserved membrane protein of unknown function [Candidatus Nitrotoga arctica]
MASKQKILSVIGLLSGALVWGLMWYPYRALHNMGIGGELSTLLSYCMAMILGLLFLGPIWRELRIAGWLSIVLMASAGWTNLGYVLAVLDGEVMRVLLLFYLAPLWTVIFSRWLLGEKLNRYGYAIIALSLGGAFVMLWDRQHGLPLPQNQAEWIGLSAGISFALMNVIVRRTQHLSVNFKVASVWFGTMLFTTVLLLYQGNVIAQWQNIPSDAWWLLWLIGLVVCVISFAVQYGLTYLPANQAIVLLLSELVFAAVSSYLLADEEMGLREIIGAALIVSASLLSGKCTSHNGK